MHHTLYVILSFPQIKKVSLSKWGGGAIAVANHRLVNESQFLVLDLDVALEKEGTLRDDLHFLQFMGLWDGMMRENFACSLKEDI
jgi:hypothetical protein